MPSKVLIHHSRGTKREGAATLIAGVAIPGCLVASLHIFLGSARQENPFFFYAFHIIGLLIGGLVVFGYAIPNLLMDREFRFVLSENQIECQSPAKVYGESYTIPIDEIIGLQEDNQSGDGTTWRLVTSDYRCVTITTCYRNPVDKIVAALRQLRPDLPVRRLPNFWPDEKPSNETTT